MRQREHEADTRDNARVCLCACDGSDVARAQGLIEDMCDRMPPLIVTRRTAMGNGVATGVSETRNPRSGVPAGASRAPLSRTEMLLCLCISTDTHGPFHARLSNGLLVSNEMLSEIEVPQVGPVYCVDLVSIRANFRKLVVCACMAQIAWHSKVTKSRRKKKFGNEDRNVVFTSPIKRELLKRH
ncbi:hypothetical protein EVAR_89831_1 [Eumeta japonica]|uniref:Uncharacterized protein n=1 Tax=Eumeta variegata TaxID=151549 RepID=A0A4C2AG45_EUMVA|nr:hypothetical protein EVAR_89831_1 [Eumeta japonica]